MFLIGIVVYLDFPFVLLLLDMPEFVHFIYWFFGYISNMHVCVNIKGANRKPGLAPDTTIGTDTAEG